jgi:Fe2+ transport system protein FeoA
MPTTFDNLARTVHLPTAPAEAPVETRHASRKGLRLSDLQPGETVRVLRLALPEMGCRKRFAELGLAEGMKCTLLSGGDTLMLLIGGSRMALASRCADEIFVSRIPAARAS